MSFSFIHTSDIHLGRSFSDLSVLSDKMQICKDSCFKAFDKIVNLAIDKRVDFVLIAGDSFDSEEKDLQSKIKFIRNLKILADNNIISYVICGNHDSIDSFQKNQSYFNFDEKYKGMINITGVTTEDYCETYNYNNIVNIHSISFQKDESGNPCNNLKQADLSENIFNIGLIHCDLEKSGTKYAPCTKEDLKKLGYDYYALGHIHKPEEQDNIVYSGSPQGRTKKETDEHGCYFVKVDDNKNIEKQFIPTDTVRFTQKELDCSNYYNVDEVFNGITETINSTNLNDIELNLFEVNLTGITEAYKELSQSNLLDDYIKSNSDNELKHVAVYEINNNTKPDVNEKEIENDKGIIGIINTVSKNKEDFYKNTVEFQQNIYKRLDLDNNIKQEFIKALEEDEKEILEKVENEIKSLCKELYSNMD